MAKENASALGVAAHALSTTMNFARLLRLIGMGHI